MTLLIVVLLILARPAWAEPTNTRAPSWPSSEPSQPEISILTAKTPLAELSPVPFSADEERVHVEVDAAICSSYRRWRAQGNGPSAHMESWCPARILAERAGSSSNSR